MSRRVVVAVLAVLLLTALALPGCFSEVIAGSGNLITEEEDLRDFNRIEVSSAFEVEVVQSDVFSVSITADGNLFQYIKVSQSGETLKIDLKRGSYHFTDYQARITMPDLYELTLSGATRGAVRGFSSVHNFSTRLSGANSLDIFSLSSGDVDFNLSGASRVIGSLNAGDAEFSLSGASAIQLVGSADDVAIDASGASSVEFTGFVVNNVDISLSGASSGLINMDGRLDADLSGASRLSYVGQPTMGDISISGASTLHKR